MQFQERSLRVTGIEVGTSPVRPSGVRMSFWEIEKSGPGPDFGRLYYSRPVPAASIRKGVLSSGLGLDRVLKIVYSDLRLAYCHNNVGFIVLCIFCGVHNCKIQRKIYDFLLFVSIKIKVLHIFLLQLFMELESRSLNL